MTKEGRFLRLQFKTGAKVDVVHIAGLVGLEVAQQWLCNLPHGISQHSEPCSQEVVVPLGGVGNEGVPVGNYKQVWGLMHNPLGNCWELYG